MQEADGARFKAVDLTPSRSNCPALILSVTGLDFAQVPRAFVNLVKVLEIIDLRELYNEKKVSCPRLILRYASPPVPERAIGPFAESGSEELEN